MIIVGVRYTAAGLTNMNEITGGSPYGAGTWRATAHDNRPKMNWRLRVFKVATLRTSRKR